MAPAPLLKIEIEDKVAVQAMHRPDRRNAMSDALMREIGRFSADVPNGVRFAVLTVTGGHYCSGSILSEHVSRDTAGTMRHSRD